ncbi:hypothetical protein PENTCL1PPCAC_17388, partial [Pristionchus entomophagus]
FLVSPPRFIRPVFLHITYWLFEDEDQVATSRPATIAKNGLNEKEGTEDSTQECLLQFRDLLIARTYYISRRRQAHTRIHNDVVIGAEKRR